MFSFSYRIAYTNLIIEIIPSCAAFDGCHQCGYFTTQHKDSVAWQGHFDVLCLPRDSRRIASTLTRDKGGLSLFTLNVTLTNTRNWIGSFIHTHKSTIHGTVHIFLNSLTTSQKWLLSNYVGSNRTTNTSQLAQIEKWSPETQKPSRLIDFATNLIHAFVHNKSSHTLDFHSAGGCRSVFSLLLCMRLGVCPACHFGPFVVALHSASFNLGKFSIVRLALLRVKCFFLYVTSVKDFEYRYRWRLRIWCKQLD